MKISSGLLFVSAMTWGLCSGEEAEVKPVDVSELRRLLKRATAMTVSEVTGRQSMGAALVIETQGKMVLMDTAGAQVRIECNNVSEIALKSSRRSVGSRVAEWVVVAGGGSASIALGAGVHPAFFGGVPAAILGGRSIVKKSTKTRIILIRPRCSTFP